MTDDFHFVEIQRIIIYIMLDCKQKEEGSWTNTSVIKDKLSKYSPTRHKSIRETVYIIKLREYDKQKLTNMFVEELLDFLKMCWSIGHIRFV